MNECFPVPKRQDDGTLEWFVYAETPQEAAAQAARTSGGKPGVYEVSSALDLSGEVVFREEVG